MIKQLAHVCILARDLKETEDFYCNKLGLEKGFLFEKEGKPFGLYLKLGNNTYIEIFQGGGENQKSNMLHLCFETEDIDAMRKRVEQQGIPIKAEKSKGSDNTWQFWIQDPNGIDIEFHQYTDKSMQKVGGVCPVTW